MPNKKKRLAIESAVIFLTETKRKDLENFNYLQL